MHSREERLREVLEKLFYSDEKRGTPREKPALDARNPDILKIQPEQDKNTIGIAQVKNMLAFVGQKPFTHTAKAVILPQADLLTPAAQNAMLKTLEEPPEYATIVLMTKTKGAVLDTVVSRCFLVDAFDYEKAVGVELAEDRDFATVLALSTGDRLQLAAELASEERETIIELLEQWLAQDRQLGYKNSEVLEQVRQDLANTNVNLKLAVEFLVLNLTT